MLRLALLLWFALAGCALTQVVTVRSGEHPGFSRLVLTLPEPAGWDLGRTGDGYGFRARKAAWRYDVSTVFDLIPRDRLAALWVDPDSGVLRMGLGCDCHVIATPFRPGIVVVDILDGPAPADSPYEAALSNAGRAMPALVARNTLRPRPRPAPPPSMPDMREQVRAADLAPGPPLSVPVRSPRADALRDRLLHDLSRSIASGAVESAAALPARGPQVLPLTGQPGSPPAAVSDRETTQLRIRPPGEPADRTISSTGQTCVPDADLNLSAWGDDRHPLEQLVSAQATLLGEFDHPDQDRLVALVRLHLHLGFGAEARNILQLWAEPGPETAVLDALGRLIDAEAGATVFAGMQGCDTAAALWAALTQDRLPPLVDVNRGAVLRAFSALPLHLRRHLGPPLSERFLAAGDADSARAVHGAVDRAAGPHGAGLTLTEARLDAAAGKTAAAEHKLKTIVSENGAAAALALATLVSGLVDRGETPKDEQIIALDAMLREHEGAADAPILRRALARGLTVAGDAERAFRDLAAQDAASFPGLWHLLAERGDALVLAALALNPPTGSTVAIPPPTRLAIARRLQEGGFAEAARQWAQEVGTPEADVILARVALDLRDGREALRRLAGQAGPEAMTLRARALEQMGDLPGALAAWQAMGNATEAARIQFLSRQWDGAMPADPAVQSLLATLNVAVSDQPPSDAPLAQARALLDQSGDTRRAVATVMAARPVPDG